MQILSRVLYNLVSKKSADFLIECTSGLITSIRSRNFVPMIAMAFSGWFSSIMMVYLLLSMGSSQPVTLVTASFVFLCTLLGGTIAILPAAAGTFHAAGIGGMLIVGYSPLEAAVLAAALHVQAFLFPILYSLWRILVGSWNLADLRSYIGNNDQIS